MNYYSNKVSFKEKKKDAKLNERKFLYKPNIESINKFRNYSVQIENKKVFRTSFEIKIAAPPKKRKRNESEDSSEESRSKKRKKNSEEESSESFEEYKKKKNKEKKNKTKEIHKKYKSEINKKKKKRKESNDSKSSSEEEHKKKKKERKKDYDSDEEDEKEKKLEKSKEAAPPFYYSKKQKSKSKKEDDNDKKSKLKNKKKSKEYSLSETEEEITSSSDSEENKYMHKKRKKSKKEKDESDIEKRKNKKNKKRRQKDISEESESEEKKHSKIKKKKSENNDSFSENETTYISKKNEEDKHEKRKDRKDKESKTKSTKLKKKNYEEESEDDEVKEKSHNKKKKKKIEELSSSENSNDSPLEKKDDLLKQSKEKNDKRKKNKEKSKEKNEDSLNKKEKKEEGKKASNKILDESNKEEVESYKDSNTILSANNKNLNNFDANKNKYKSEKILSKKSDFSSNESEDDIKKKDKSKSKNKRTIKNGQKEGKDEKESNSEEEEKEKYVFSKNNKKKNKKKEKSEESSEIKERSRHRKKRGNESTEEEEEESEDKKKKRKHKKNIEKELKKSKKRDKNKERDSSYEKKYSKKNAKKNRREIEAEESEDENYSSENKKSKKKKIKKDDSYDDSKKKKKHKKDKTDKEKYSSEDSEDDEEKQKKEKHKKKKKSKSQSIKDISEESESSDKVKDKKKKSIKKKNRYEENEEDEEEDEKENKDQNNNKKDDIKSENKEKIDELQKYKNKNNDIKSENKEKIDESEKNKNNDIKSETKEKIDESEKNENKNDDIKSETEEKIDESQKNKNKNDEDNFNDEKLNKVCKKEKNKEEEEEEEEEEEIETSLKADLKQDLKQDIKKDKKKLPSSSSSSSSENDEKEKEIEKNLTKDIEEKPKEKSNKTEVLKNRKIKIDKNDNKQYITNIKTIKIIPTSKNETGFLKDNKIDTAKTSNEDFIFAVDQKISDNIDILEKMKQKLREQKDFFDNLGYVLTDKSCERMAMLIHYILSGIPVLLEGQTGTAKTRTALIACEFISKIINKDSKDDDSLLRFNLSAETKIDDLLVKFAGDNESASGLKVEEGQFFKAYTRGHKILLDEINLAPREVLECIQQALDNKILSVESSGKVLKKYPMNKNFGIIATQNPNKGAFEKKRQDLGLGLLSRFQKIYYPNLTKDEMIEIAKGLAKQNNYKGDENLLLDIVSFHMDWQEETNLVDEVQCFTIREIEGVIRALAQDKNAYDTIMTVYGARYQKNMKEKLKKKLKNYNTLSKLKPSPLALPKEFPNCFANNNLCDTVSSVIFSLTNKRHSIIVGEEESGITQVARWCADYFNKITNNENQKSCLCLCTKNLQCSDLIGQTKPCPKNDKSDNNEILKFIPGLLVDALEKGRTVVLDYINEANATVCERLNGLLDKKNNEEEEYFDLPENTEKLRIPIHKNFRMICTCNINNLKDMSPAFVNRFDVVVLENQLENLNYNQYQKLISNIFISIENMPKRQKKIDTMSQKIFKEIEFEEEDDFENIEPNNIDERENFKALENKEELVIRENEFIIKEKNLINLIFNKITNLPESRTKPNAYGYSHLRTMTALSRFCYSVFKLRKIFREIKYENHKITDDDIINTVFEMIFRDDYEKIEISENIKNALLKELIHENQKRMNRNGKNEYEKYFFEKSESLRKFVLFVYISSLINLYLCVVSPPGAGKTTAARSISEIRAKILGQQIPFYIHTHHSSTKPNDFYGTTTISDSQIIFKEGSLTLAITEGSVYIADEFNISSTQNMKSVTPVLEQIFNQDLIIPGIEGNISIDPNFFFIICQNDVGTFGRNELPDKLKTKLRKVIYPEQTKEEIESICVSINNSFYETNQNKLEDIEAKYCGDFMIKINQNNLTSQPWSLRDISKIFLRIKNQKIFSENYKGIGTEINLLFYALSSVTMEQLNEEYIDNLIKALKEIFRERINEEDLKRMFSEEEKATLFNELNPRTKVRKYYIQKYNSFIFFDEIDENSKRDEEKRKKKRKILEKYSKLPNFLDCLFKMKLSNFDEPLLLSGPTCYKTFAAKMLLRKADVVSLNQESTIPQLLGSSFFYPPLEDKKFCFRLIYEILGIPNIDIEVNKIDKWDVYKEEILETIENNMPDANSSFYYAVNNLKKKLFSEEKANEKSLINMKIEFKPGLILSAILNKKSLILKDMPQVKTIVLERFNELFSGKHNLTLVEDIPGTLTGKENKELRNFNKDFRVIATCKPGDELKLSEALLSRFTVIACEPYTEEEEKIVLENTAVENIDINEFNNLAPNFNLTKRLNCLRITKKLDKFNNNNHDINLKISIYLLQKGLIEQRESQISKLQKLFKLNIPDYQDGICPFEDPNNSKEKGNQYLQSKIYKIKMLSFQKKIKFNDKKIFFTKKFSEMCDVILFGLSLRLPIILEGEAGQGKQTAIHYMAQKLGLDIINIVISKSTKVDDLLMKIIIEKTESGEIIVKNQETELYKAIKSTDEHQKKLIVFQGINNASPAVLDVLNSIFIPDANILLSNGSILEKGNMNIIAIFNKGRDNINRDKIPTGILSNCIYHIVDNPSNDDILKIITNLFMRMDFGEKENIKYVKNYLIENRIDNIKTETEAEKLLKDENYFKENFEKAKAFEAEDFSKKFLEAIIFSLETTNESPFTLNDIKKYIEFRESVPQINNLLIQLFIFVYHFSQEENINKITERLNLLKNIEFLPTIDYDEDKKHIVIKLEKESKEFIRAKVKNPDKIKIKKCKKLFYTLTKHQKHCFIFLICCLKSKKTPLIQGPTASGKSYLLNVFSKLLGQDPNLYQMNSNSVKKIIYKKKDKKSFNDMGLKDYKKIIMKIDKYLKKSENLDEKTIDQLKKARRTIFIITSPPSRFIHLDSVFTDSILKDDGQWVILDGIEMAPSQIPEKISPLCGENPEISIFESGKGIYITSKDIKENFHLFIIYNPFNKGSKIIDQVLFNKCVSFTLPSIDNSPYDSSSIIYNSINFSKNTNKKIWNILCSKLAASHITASKISENHLEQMAGGIKITPRNLAFLITDKNSKNNNFNDNNIDETIIWIKSALTFYYFNSFFDASKEKKGDNNEIYTKNDFQITIYNSFKERPKYLIIANEDNISEEEMFHEIVKILKEIQISSENGISKFNFNFGEFVKLCLDVPIQQTNLEYIKNQIDDTINLLNNSNLSNEFLFSFYQIKIIGKLFNDLLENIGEIKAEQKGLKLNSDSLINIKSLKNIKKILLKLRLLEGLTNKGKTNFGYLMNPILHQTGINKLLLHLNDLILNRNKSTLKNFIYFCLENHTFIDYIEIVFPFNKFIENYKGTDFELSYFYIKFMIEFYKNKNNFIFIFDEEEVSFIFEINQYNKLLPILKLNEKNNLYLSVGTMFKYYKSKDAKMSNAILINNDEYVNEEKTLQWINFLIANSGIFDPNNFRQNYYIAFNEENQEKICSKKFLISNLFLTNNGIIPKIWTLLFSFNEDSEVLNYIITNLLPFEREIFEIVDLNFYLKLNEKSDIENCLDFTERLNFFYNEDSFLWRNLIGKKLEQDLREEEYKNYLVKIENEKLKLDILRDFSWPEKSINDFKQILEIQLKEIYNKIETDQLTKEEKNAINKLTDLGIKLSKIKLKAGLEIFKRNLKEKIENLKKEKLKVMQEKTKEIEKEIEDLISITKEGSKAISGNDLNWVNPILNFNHLENSKRIKLYKNMLFYSVCTELEKKIINSTDNKERYRYGEMIGNLGLNSILQFINSFENESLGNENRKKIKSMIRAQLMLKIYNDGIDQSSVKNFLKELNDRASRKSIIEDEYEFTYKIASKYSLTTKIIQPKFESQDILYLFFKYNENNEYMAGPIFNNIKSMSMKMNNIYNEAFQEINKKKLENICDICLKTSKIIYREFLNVDEALPKNFEKLISFFEEKNKNLEEDNQKKILTALINVIKLSKYFDGIIKSEVKEIINFDDMVIFEKKNNNRIDIESLLKKKINPSFKYFIIKNLPLIDNLINSKLSQENISEVLSPQIGEIYIPFWVFLIRNMSAINCINYENKNNILDFCKEISDEVRKKIEDLIKNEKGEDLDNCWLNLILKNIPNEIKIINIRLFYIFFDNLLEKLSADNKYMKEEIIKILKDFYIELINYSLNGKIYTLLSSDISKSEILLLELVNSPKECIKKIIINKYEEKAKSIVINDQKKDLEDNLEKLIKEIPGYIEKIKVNVTNVENIYKEEQEKNEIDKIIEKLTENLEKYNEICDNLFLSDSQIKCIYQINSKYIRELEEKMNSILEYQEILIKEKNSKINYYYKIPIKNKRYINIFYDNYQIIKGDNLYFKKDIKKIEKNKFSVRNNNNDNNNELNVEDYILFKKIKEIQVFKYKFDENDEVRNKIKKNFINKITPKKVNFKGKNFDQISYDMNDLKNILKIIQEKITFLKQGKFQNLDMKNILNSFKTKYDDFKYYFDIKNNETNEAIDFSQIINIKTELEQYLLAIQNEFESLYYEYQNIFKNISPQLTKDLNTIFIDNFNMPLLPEKKPHFVKYDNLKTDSSLLSMPMVNKKDGVLKCNYNKMTFQKGPFYPELYSKPIILNIVSLVDEEIIAEIEELPEKNEKIQDEVSLYGVIDEKGSDINSEEEKGKKGKVSKIDEEKKDDEDIKTVYRRDSEIIKYMKVKKYIKPKELIPIEIYIPNLIEKGKKENQRIRRLLKLTSGKTNCEMEIDMKILTLPIETLLSCENYQLEYINGNFHLKANKLFSKEKIIFHIQNYIKGQKNIIKERIDSLEANTYREPKVKIENNKLIVIIPEINNNEPKRINCKIECYLSPKYKISIIIDSVIIPIYYSFEAYDYINSCYTSKNIELLIPKCNSNLNFIRYLPQNNKLAIKIHFTINFPCKSNSIKAKIIAFSKQKMENNSKEIILNNERNEFSFLIEIDFEKSIDYEIASFKCDIEGIIKEIKFVKKDCSFYLNDLKQTKLDILRYYDNFSNGTFELEKIENAEHINYKDIYIFPFGYLDYQISCLIKKADSNGEYYILDRAPINNKIYFIDNNGNIKTNENFKNYSYRGGLFWLNEIKNFSLFGMCKNKWYPLIIEYEDYNELFGTFSSKYELGNFYKNKNYFSAHDDVGFLRHLEKMYPSTYSKMKSKFTLRKTGQSIDNYSNDIFEIMKKERTLDVLKRFEKIKKDDKFTFSYLAYLIFEKTKDTLNSFNSFLPEEIKSQISFEINDILKYIDADKKELDWKNFNEKKLNLINKIYFIFIKKKKEIEGNNNIISFSSINSDLYSKIDKLQKEFFFIPKNGNRISLSDSIGKLSQKILSIEQDISKSELKLKNMKFLDKNKEEVSQILADKFLIIDDKAEKVDKNKKPIHSKYISDISNQSNTVDEIELEDMNEPDSYTINSLMEYYGRCILKTQMLPAFIRYAVITKNEEKITKSTNFISTLFNLYNISNNHNFSLISPRIEEFQKSFEIMISKLKKSGADFSKDKDLKKLNFADTNENEDFIKLPEKDNFEIQPNNFEQDFYEENNITRAYTYRTKNLIKHTKTGILSIEDSEVMNLEYENLIKQNKNITKAKKQRKKSNENINRKASNSYNNPEEVIQPNKDLQKAFTILDDIKDNPPPQIDLNIANHKKNIPKTGWVRKKIDNKKVKMLGKNFEEQNFDIEKETLRAIKKMKNIKRKKLKLDEITEREGKLDKLFYSDKLKELLKESIEIKNDSTIYKLNESSEFLFSRIYSQISKLNLTQEIPFKNLEINILIDCARTISDTEKFFVMLQVCSFASVFYSLEVPYLISLVGDSGFKVVLKELDDEHSIENLQKVLDCVFIKRFNTNIASCIKTATDKFKTLENENCQRVFYMFTNGLDEEFALYEQWKERIFTNPSNSFAFILSKPKNIKDEHSQFLTEFWNKFGSFCKSNNFQVEMIEMDKERLYIKKENSYEINEEYLKNYIKAILNVLRRYKDKDNNNNTEKALFETKKLNNIPSKDNFKNLENIITDNSLRDIKEEPFIKKIKLPQIQEAVPKMNKYEIKEISKNIGSIMKVVDSINNEEKNEIKDFMKLFKIRKEKINLSILDLIFKPNLPTQTILTDVGSHIDVNELIKYFLNPTPNPRIYRELGDGFIKNYGITVIIDSSISCFNSLASQHTWNTIQILLSALGAIDLPCFDLIISGDPNPYVICSEKNSLDILSEKSQIWPILFDMLNKNIKNTDLSSAIRAAYNLHNLRKSEHPDFLFVITDGLFSLSETKRIIKNVVFCMNKGLNVFGIGVGFSPFGIENLFPNVVYSLNPDKLIQGIASCFSGNSLNNSRMKLHYSELKIKFNESNIEDSQKNPIYKKLKQELINIPVELSGYDYYQAEIPPNAEEEELSGNGRYSVHNYGMYERNFFKGQKLLIVMPYSYGMNEGEDERLSYKYITMPKNNNLECIQSSIDYTGIKVDVVINYKDAINKLIRPGTYKKNCCDYYACIIMSGEPYAELPNNSDDPYLFGQFVNVIKEFWNNGGALGIFADNAPFNYQTNILIEELFPNSKFRIAGNHPGMKTIFGDNSGILKNNGTFNRMIQMVDNYARNTISHSLNKIYEGKTLSYCVEKPKDDDLLYYGKNEDLVMITDPKQLVPFVPFSKDSEGGFNSLFYSSNDNKGDIVIDCSYTKFFLEMETEGTPRYIQNIVSWLGAPEKHQQRDMCKDGSDFRPRSINIKIDWHDKWQRFKERPKILKLKSLEEMKTIFAVDCSSSIRENMTIRDIYFNKLIDLKSKYYKSSRGDKFYTWGTKYYYKTESEMDKFIQRKNCTDGTYSYNIAEIGKETLNENFEHLIIVTDGKVSVGDIDECERRVEKYGLKYSFVSTYIIGKGGDESVGCPFSRGCPGNTYLIDRYGNENIKVSLSNEDLNTLKKIDSINNWLTFKSKYKNLFNAIRAKCLGRNADNELKKKLNNMKNRISDTGLEQDDFITKFNNLFRMADGQIRNVKNAAVAA